MVGNHPQLNAALSNVQALHAAYAAHQRERVEGRRDGSSRRDDASEDDDDGRRRKKRRCSSKHKKKSKKPSKEKRRRRDRDERDERKRHRRRRDSSGSSSESSSESDSGSDGAPRWSVREQVERGRLAMDAMRHMLAKFPSERNSFRDLLRTVDGGQGVATAGVADSLMRNYLDYFFDHACLVRSSRTGMWALDKRDLSLLSRFGAVFDESAGELEKFSAAREPWTEPTPDADAGKKSRSEEKRAKKAQNVSEVRVLTGDEAHAATVEDASDSDKNAPQPTIGTDIGPSMPPPKDDKAGQENADAPTKRVLGPMVPPKSMLEAAAAELAFDSSFGPPPPELIAEMENTTNETREACAMRLVRIVKRGGDAYDILSVAPGDTKSVIKKKYWKLSLMVHPDKCSHEDAKEAFDAIKKAHTALSDDDERAKIDAKRNEANEREEFEKWLEGEREKAAWRRMKGTPLPGDDELLDGAKDEGDKREEWMTHLPPEKRAQGPPTVNVTAFAKTEKVARTAEMEAAWTDTPQQAAEREKQLFLQAQEQQYVLPAAKAKEEETKRLVEEYNASRRAKSLVEVHQEKQRDAQKKERKEKKEKKDKKDKKESPNDGTNWEYRPFDRDTDLNIRKPGELKPEEMLKRAGGGLGDRFRS